MTTKNITREPVNTSMKDIAKQLEEHITKLERLTAMLSAIPRLAYYDDIGRLAENGRDLCSEISCALFKLSQKLDEHKTRERERHYAILFCPDRSLSDAPPNHQGHVYEFDTKKDRDIFLSVVRNPLFKKVVVV